MKKLLVIGLLFAAPVLAEDKLLKDTAYAVAIDQQARERIFTTCLNVIKSQSIKGYEYLEDAINQCGKEATKIALRGPHTGNDGNRYITVIPTEVK